MRGLSSAIAIIIAVASFMSAFAFEGIWHQTEKVEAKSPDLMPEGISEISHSTVYFKNGIVKIVDKEKGQTFIFRPDRKLIWIIDTAGGTYREITFRDMKLAIEKSNQVIKDIEGKLESLPTEQREAVEKIMKEVHPKEMPKEALSYRSTGKRSKIIGYNCENYVIERDGEEVAKMWVTDEIDLGKEFYEGLNRAFETVSGTQAFPGRELYEVAKEIKGFPLKSTCVFEGLVTTSDIVEIEGKKLDNSEFELPPGLTKIEREERNR